MFVDEGGKPKVAAPRWARSRTSLALRCVVLNLLVEKIQGRPRVSLHAMMQRLPRHVPIPGCKIFPRQASMSRAMAMKAHKHRRCGQACTEFHALASSRLFPELRGVGTCLDFLES